MAISFSRPDPSSPAAVAAAAFPTARKGFEPSEVRDFLRMVAAELARLQEREKFLEGEVSSLRRGGATGAVALDEELVTRMLGEEAARILSTAREAASQIKIRAEDGAARLLREATDEAQRLREEAEIESSRRRADAAADAEAELEMAKQQGREMVNEARAYRERVLSELARRRELARQQIEQLVHGRDRLLQAFERARHVAVDVMDELGDIEAPAEYVDLSPTTGPVPVMVKGSPRPGTTVHSEPDAEAPDPTEVPAEPDVHDSVADVTVEPQQDDDGSADDPTVEPIAVGEVTEPVVVVVDDDVIDDGVDAGDDEDETVEMHAAVDVVVEAADGSDTVVHLEVGSLGDVSAAVAAIEALTGDEERPDTAGPASSGADADPPTNVVPLFGDEIRGEQAAPKNSVDDLFARLRASRSSDVARRVAEPDGSADGAAEPDPATVSTGEPEPDTAPVAVIVGDSVFAATPDAPVEDAADAETPFARRDEALTPIIVAAARKLKRVLADEQNEVLHTLRRKEPVRSVDVMLPPNGDQTARYAAAVEPELLDAAVAGAASMGVQGGSVRKSLTKASAARDAVEALGAELVAPLRDRLARCVDEADGDNAELATLVRAVYREWKNQRIDEHLDDIARAAFGRGALTAIAPGTPICWIVDPNGPACPDAEDNSLGGVIPAGSAFPTDDVCAPAHAGCRCMIALADG